MSLKKINTPCIGICSTIYGDETCRGCKRHYQEVIEWNTYSSTQQQDIFERLWSDIVNICKNKFCVTDKTKLSEQCDKYNIRYSSQQDALCWAFYLLREGHEKIQNIENYGIKVFEEYSSLTLSELYKSIDQALLTHSQSA